MDYKFFNLGQLTDRDVIEVTISNATVNLRLMDQTNFDLYKAAKEFSFYGGVMQVGTHKLPVPRAAHWFVVHDMKDLQGQGAVTAKILARN